MGGRRRTREPSKPGAGRGTGVPRRLPHERWWVAALLAVHVALAGWGALRTSVTFDENFHVPSGVMIAAQGDLRVHPVNPPLAKALCGLAALAAGARLPSEATIATGDQYQVAESFMRANAARYHAVFVAARLVVVLLSVLLGWLIWRVARRLYGAAAGVLALGFYAFLPEALAHAGVATLDLATALALLASVYAFWMFARVGRWGWWWAAAAATAAAFLVRYTALLLGPTLLAIAILEVLRHRARHPRRLWIGLGLLIPVVILALDAGYLFGVRPEPLREWPLRSETFRALQQALPWLRLPVAFSWVMGLDYQSQATQAGMTPGYLLGRVLDRPVWYYFPLALLFKLPLGFLGALLARAVLPRAGRGRRDAFLVLPVAFLMASGMFLLPLNAGVRYMFPLLPFLCVWLGGLASARLPAGGGRRARSWLRLGVALALLQAVETGWAAPWYLSFYNWPSGGPGGGDRLVNDSNVDWGQGLLALRDEMRERGIERIHLAYHGTTDPAVYGIAYVPYLGGTPGPESDWLAVSSYYFVGLGQSMMTSRGRTEPLRFDLRPLWDVTPAARPGDCMYLFRVRGPGGVR